MYGLGHTRHKVSFSPATLAAGASLRVDRSKAVAVALPILDEHTNPTPARIRVAHAILDVAFPDANDRLQLSLNAITFWQAVYQQALQELDGQASAPVSTGVDSTYPNG